MAEKIRIFFERHGEPDFPDRENKIIYGWTDFHLSALGRAQAGAAAVALSAVKFDRIFSSDLVRARETADLAAAAQSEPIDITIDRDFRELFVGDWEGMRYSDLGSDLERYFTSPGCESMKTPGGESFVDLRDRAMAAFERALDASEGASRILITAHGGSIWSIISTIIGMPLGDMYKTTLDYCGINIVDFYPKHRFFRLARMNWSPRLETESKMDIAAAVASR